jgi:hypothetical protein
VHVLWGVVLNIASDLWLLGLTITDSGGTIQDCKVGRALTGPNYGCANLASGFWGDFWQGVEHVLVVF